MKRNKIVRLPQEHIRMIHCIKINYNQKTFADAARKASKMLEPIVFKKRKK